MGQRVELIAPSTEPASIQAAVQTARKSDVAILVVGENESTNREAWSEQHRGDRDSLDLLGAQNDLVKAVVETGTPTVVLLLNGRPLSSTILPRKSRLFWKACIWARKAEPPRPRCSSATSNPGGKLPITFPHSVGDLPDFYNHKPSDNRSYAVQHPQAALRLRLRPELYHLQLR